MFRTLGKSKIAFLLAILFGVSLFFFKSGSRYSNFLDSDSVIAKVSSTPISTNKFNRTMQMNISSFNQMIGKEMSGEEIRDFQIHSLALRALINDAVFENEFDKLKYEVDEKVIAKRTKKKIPQLYDSNNNLNETYLSTFLQQQQLHIEDIVQIIDFETREEYFSNAFFEVNYPKYFSKKIDNYNQHKRSISYIEFDINRVSINKIKNELSSSLETELAEFYEKNINDYMQKEKRSVEYFLIDKSEMRQKFVPSEYEIKEYYESNKNLYKVNEKRDFIQFNFKTKKEAEKFKSDTLNLNLKKIIEYSNKNNLKYNDFQNLESSEVLDQIAQPLFKLNLNEKSDVIETSLAKHILILKSIDKPFHKKLDEVSSDIKYNITEVDTNNYFKDILDQISKKIINGDSILDIATSMGLRLQTIDNLTKDFKDYDKKLEIYLSSLVNSAFNSNKDFVSNIESVNQDLAFVYNVKDIVISTPIKFTKVKKNVLENWEIFKKIEKINKDASENTKNKNLILNLSKEYGVKINQLILNKNSNEIPSNLINKIFESKKLFNVIDVINNKVYLAKIDNIMMVDDNSSINNISINSDITNAFGQELIKNKKIKINDSLLNALLEKY